MHETDDSTNGVKTSNTAALLGLVKDAGEIVEGIPYIKAIAGVLGKLIEMKQVRSPYTSKTMVVDILIQEFDDCEDEWKTTFSNVESLREMIIGFMTTQDDPELPVPLPMRKLFKQLEDCLTNAATAIEKYQQMRQRKRFWARRELKKAAKACADDIAQALNLFQVRIIHNVRFS